MKPFAELVEESFGYLAKEFDFVPGPVETGAGASVSYAKAPLSIHFGWYKGEIEMIVSVSIDFAKNHSVFRSYISRQFTLAELALRNDEQALRPFHEAAVFCLEPAGLITSSEHTELFLRTASEVMRKHCRTVLEGDLALLEQITMERRKRA